MRTRHKKTAYAHPAHRTLRLYRLFASLLVCWTMMIGLVGLSVSSAADSPNFRLDADPLDISEANHGVSDHFQIDGAMGWKQTAIQSQNFQIVPVVSTEAGSSSTGNQSSAISSDGDSVGGTSGGGYNGNRRLPSEASVVTTASSLSTEPQTSTIQSISTSPLSSSSAHVQAASELIASPIPGGPSDPSSGRDSPGNLSSVSAPFHPASGTTRENIHWLPGITALEAAVGARLTVIYRFETMFGTLPTFQASGNFLTALASNARPGFITVESFLFPFGISRLRRRRSAKTKNAS